MPIISRFFGIIIRMFYDDHGIPHTHTEYQGSKALFDFSGNIMRGTLNSRTATKLTREWIDPHQDELSENWELARQGKAMEGIAPLD